MEENPAVVETPIENSTESVVPSPKPSRKINSKIILILSALIVVILLAGAFLLAKQKNASISSSPTPIPTVSPTSSPSSSPSASPLASVAPKPLGTALPSTSPSTSTMGTLNVVFLKWDTSASDYASKTPITGISSNIHINGAMSKDYAGSPNWSSTFAPGNYDVNVDTPSTYTYHASDCSGGDCQNLGFNCSRRVNLSAGSNVTVSCWFSN